MKLRHRVASIIGATFLFASTVVTGVAQGADATVEITPQAGGALSATISNVNFGQVTYSFTDSDPITGTLNLTSSDTRGTAAGWNITLSATDFDGDTTTDSIPVGQLLLSAGAITPTAGNTSVGSGEQTTYALSPVTTGAQTIWDAEVGFGDGTYSLAVPASLVIPGGTLVDDYKSVVTIVMGSGPS